MANDETTLPELRPTEAAEMLRENPDSVLLDVRSTMEYQFVGHVPNSVNVPLLEFPAWIPDPEFVGKARAALADVVGGPAEDHPILVICRSGGRSRAAARLLQEDGFQKVFNVSEGFEGDLDGARHRNTVNGWRFHGLPWEQT